MWINTLLDVDFSMWHSSVPLHWTNIGFFRFQISFYYYFFFIIFIRRTLSNIWCNAIDRYRNDVNKKSVSVALNANWSFHIQFIITASIQNIHLRAFNQFFLSDFSSDPSINFDWYLKCNNIMSEEKYGLSRYNISFAYIHVIDLILETE